MLKERLNKTLRYLVDTKSIRIENLNYLLKSKFDGDRSKLAEALGYKNVSYLNQLLTGHGSFGPKIAKKISDNLYLPGEIVNGVSVNWMDVPRPDTWGKYEVAVRGATSAYNSSSDDPEQSFSARLRKLLNSKGFPNGSNRVTMLAKMLSADPGSVAAWLSGRDLPTDRQMDKLADLLECDVGFLKFGPAPREPLEPVDTRVFRKLPLISHVPAGPADEPFDPYAPGAAEDWIYCPEPCSDRSYGLRVNGSSMDDDSSEGYPNGSIVFCDPALSNTAEIGDDVIAEVIDDHEAKRTFKRLDSNESGIPVLRPLNPSYPTMEVEFRVIAVVIAVSISKKKR